MRASLLLALLCISFSFAQILEADSTIDRSGAITTSFTLTLPDHAGLDATLLMQGEVDSIVVTDRSGMVLEHAASSSGGYTLISASMPVDTLVYQVRSTHQSAKSGPLWSYEMGFGSSENLSSVRATLHLPQGAVVKSTNGAVSASGDSVSLRWESGPLATGYKTVLRAGYELDDPSSQGPDPLLSIGIVLIFLLSAAVFWYLGRRAPAPIKSDPSADTPSPPPPAAPPPPPPEPQAVKASARLAIEDDPVFRTLDETDKRIVGHIAKAGGMTTQARLNLDLHIPKVTLSRRLDSLETRGIIQKSRKGIRNLVSLTDSIRF